MSDVYRAGDEQGSDFAFDATGKIINWNPVIREARKHDVRLTLSLGMLFTGPGEEGFHARASVNIPQGADERTVKQHVYAGIRSYITKVSAKVREAEREDEEEDFDDGGDGDSDGEYSAMPGTVALLSAVTMR